MIDVVPFSSQDECHLLRALVVGALVCDECSDVHGYHAAFQFLFWGLQVIWLKHVADDFPSE